jgi:hypothetical protein
MAGCGFMQTPTTHRRDVCQATTDRRDMLFASWRKLAVDTPHADIGVGDIFVTASDISEAITWLATHMGTKFTFTQGMRSLSNPLAAWSAKKGYKGLKKHPGDSTVPAKETILDYLSLILLSTDPSRAIEAAAWTSSNTATGQDSARARLRR